MGVPSLYFTRRKDRSGSRLVSLTFSFHRILNPTRSVRVIISCQEVSWPHSSQGSEWAAINTMTIICFSWMQQLYCLLRSSEIIHIKNTGVTFVVLKECHILTYTVHTVSCLIIWIILLIFFFMVWNISKFTWTV